MNTPGLDLLGAGLPELMTAAAERRDDAYGARITYSPKVFIPLTHLCRDRCGYCTFAQPPARVSSPFMSLEEVLAVARAGAAAGCHEALFTLGERPEDRYPAAGRWLAENGFDSTVDYLVAAAQAVLSEVGLLPHANAGALYDEELAALRPVAASQGMMLESLNPGLDCHRGSPDKEPARRLATLESAGRLRIPFTTGILVGIGESRPDRLEALVAIAESHARHGHVQEVIVQNFLPKPGTAMHSAAPCPPEEYLWSVAVARLLLPADVRLQAPPNLSDDFGRLLDAGIDDWGGVSPVTPDHVNPERPWPAIDRLRTATEARGFTLAPRLTIYPTYALRPEGWLDEALRFPVLDHSDAEGLAREPGERWYSGVEEEPPTLLAVGDRLRHRIDNSGVRTIEHRCARLRQHGKTGCPVVIARPAVGIDRAAHARCDIRGAPTVRGERIRRIDRQALHQQLAHRGGALRQALYLRPRRFRVYMIRGHRRHAAPVVDAGADQQVEGLVDQVRGRLDPHDRAEQESCHRDGRGEVLDGGVGDTGHRGVGLGTEVLDDDLLDAAVLSGDPADREESLGAFDQGLADADQHAGRERHGTATGILEYTQPGGGVLVGRTEMTPSRLGPEPRGSRLQHHAHRGRYRLQSLEVLPTEYACVDVRQQTCVLEDPDRDGAHVRES